MTAAAGHRRPGANRIDREELDSMKEAIHTDRAPAAIGPYSQAVRAGGFLFTSGQIPVDPAAGDIPAGIKAQAQQSLNNIAAILAQAGLDRSAVVKTTVFLKDMNDFAAMNEVYAQFFEGPAYPARSAVEVARLPKDVLVEIEAVALL